MVMRFSHPRFLCYHITLRHEQYLTYTSHVNILKGGRIIATALVSVKNNVFRFI